MLNYAYGAATTVTVMTMVEIIESNIPNTLGYYLNMVMPF